MADLRAQLIERLKKLSVEYQLLPGRDDGFAALRYQGKDFAHFHDDKELDIRLGKRVISSEGLVRPPNSRVHPNRSANSPWIEIRFSKAAELDRIVRLVELAIKQL